MTVMITDTAETWPTGHKLRAYTSPDAGRIPQLAALGPAFIREMEIVARVLPFRVNAYVVEELIDWDAVPDDPLFRMLFPNRFMLDDESFARMAQAVDNAVSAEEETHVASAIRAKLNPHPAGQLTMNTPFFEGEEAIGLQHKYPQTVLFFPSEGQTCHSYCSFCFRWPQFVHDPSLRIAARDRDVLARYLMDHTEVSDLLITGGDAFTIKSRRLRFLLECVTSPRLSHVSSVRFGTKALSFWPYRFVTEPDAGELIDFLGWLVDNGKHVTIMAHYNHPRELSTPIAREAISRIRGTGAVIRSQGPLLRGINDDASIWASLWREQVRLGIVPYYMFVARDTGPKYYFDVPLARAWQVYADAARQVSGLARTVRGPSMSTGPGKIEISGVADVAGQRVFVLRFLQSRDPAWSFRPFFAKYDPDATWLSELRPAFGEQEFFFEQGYGAMQSHAPGRGSD